MRVVAEVVSPSGFMFEVREMATGDEVPYGVVDTAYYEPDFMIEKAREGFYDKDFILQYPQPSTIVFKEGHFDRFRLYYVGKTNPEWGEVAP